jgi:peptidoglycan/xylan/chitin deacetylase (PgdA/CDA1 family)
MRGRIACLVYHRVGEADDLSFLTRGGSPVIGPRQLERELGRLARLGARFGTFADLRNGWFPGPREIGVIVSFDDGFRSNYEDGLEVLGRVGVPATIFQTSGLVSAHELVWEHALYWFTRDAETAARFARLVRRQCPDARGTAGSALVAELRDRIPGPRVEELLAEARATIGDPAAERAAAERAYPTAEQLRRARDRGHEIASHGHAHYRRETIDDAAFEADLVRSVRALGDILGTPPAAYSYPYDSHRPGDDTIEARHFLQAATVGRRPIERDTDPLWIPRFAWPGPPRNALRERRWLLTGRI